MTTTVPTPARSHQEKAARHDRLLPRLFAAFLVLHGLVHLLGFTVPWGLGGLKRVGYSPTVLNGSIDLGDAAFKGLGLVWLAVAVAFSVVGVMVWRAHPWARRATLVVVLASLVLCAIGLPSSVMGLGIDVGLLALMALASDRLFGPAGFDYSDKAGRISRL